MKKQLCLLTALLMSGTSTQAAGAGAWDVVDHIVVRVRENLGMLQQAAPEPIPAPQGPLNERPDGIRGIIHDFAEWVPELRRRAPEVVRDAIRAVNDRVVELRRELVELRRDAARMAREIRDEILAAIPEDVQREAIRLYNNLLAAGREAGRIVMAFINGLTRPRTLLERIWG